MLKEGAADFMELGKRLYDVTGIYGWDQFHPLDKTAGIRRLNEEGESRIRDELRKAITLASRLKLPVSTKVLERHLAYPNSTPQSVEEYEKLVDIFKDELASQTFLFVPQHLASYYEWDGIVSDAVSTAFPKASEEIRSAGTCLAAGQHTACVFHAMRAAEIGLRVMATELKANISKPIESADWMEMLNGMTGALKTLENSPKTPSRDDELEFFSEAAAQFRFFKNGWRVRVAHALATYNEQQAKDTVDHVRSFFETLARRLHE